MLHLLSDSLVVDPMLAEVRGLVWKGEATTLGALIACLAASSDLPDYLDTHMYCEVEEMRQRVLEGLELLVERGHEQAIETVYACLSDPDAPIGWQVRGNFHLYGRIQWGALTKIEAIGVMVVLVRNGDTCAIASACDYLCNSATQGSRKITSRPGIEFTLQGYFRCKAIVVSQRHAAERLSISTEQTTHELKDLSGPAGTLWVQLDEGNKILKEWHGHSNVPYTEVDFAQDRSLKSEVFKLLYAPVERGDAKAIAAVFACARSENVDSRRAAARLLLKIAQHGDAQAWEQLCVLFDDEDDRVCGRAAHSLKQFIQTMPIGVRYVDSLQKLLDSDRSHIRALAWELLTRLAERRMESVLVLARSRSLSPHSRVKAEAWEAIMHWSQVGICECYLKPEDALGTHALCALNVLMHHRSEGVRTAALEAIGEAESRLQAQCSSDVQLSLSDTLQLSFSARSQTEKNGDATLSGSSSHSFIESPWNHRISQSCKTAYLLEMYGASFDF